ncbi:peroxiredoxin (alkyl hydroperoxide reductase subunit C) [Fusarium proliferatum]|nr:peroxiredoxin (alkyl hydroperoxide reductase subunit C) [Fusarium proliferatum]
MSFRAPIRRIALARPALAARGFHSTPRAFVRVGQEIPNLDVLLEDSPGNKVNLAEEFQSANGYIVGVPAAFSGTCSSKHIPSYINHPKLKQAGQVFVVSVNDPFVMKAWSEQLDPAKQTGVIRDYLSNFSQIRFLGDPTGEFTKALDLGFEAYEVFGGMRGKRYALKVEDGKVSKAHVEPDNTGSAVSMAEQVLD